MSWLDTSHKSSSRFGMNLGRSSRSFSYAEPEINLIAFIDVLLVILIFLMISTTFTKFQEIAITLPTASGVETVDSAREINIAVSSDGRFALNGKVMNRAQLGSALKQMNASSEQNLRISIDADARAPHQAVMTVLELARDAGLPNIAFSSQAKK
ncbi:MULTISPECIES: ExbD/TolR family protein [unclassified Polynucleobacter]|uniref:ExbD/TolR family protein n=1 Tax=unclassified Polynucleobacter TaxID=2640945 RepID=UPI0025735EDE|nr:MULTISPECIES: biopolymer transporter ExbD [unclassified Polynucleobacter]BEI42111.1 biopolymer transporter ExbD [Polynucleobacter sp. HIN10]BEI43889.1 biopolymer transporter ExbD [Polynucleobacter sp. HIN11]